MWKTLLRYADDFWRAGKAFFTSNKTAIANTADDVIKGAAASTDDIAAKAATLPPVGKPLGYAMADDFIATSRKQGVSIIGDNMVDVANNSGLHQVRAITTINKNGTVVTKGFDVDGLRFKEAFNENMTSVASFSTKDGKLVRLAEVLKAKDGTVRSVVKAGKTLSPVNLDGRNTVLIPENLGLRNFTEKANHSNLVYESLKKQGYIKRLGFAPMLGY